MQPSHCVSRLAAIPDDGASVPTLPVLPTPVLPTRSYPPRYLPTRSYPPRSYPPGPTRRGTYPPGPGHGQPVRGAVLSDAVRTSWRAVPAASDTARHGRPCCGMGRPVRSWSRSGVPAERGAGLPTRRRSRSRHTQSSDGVITALTA